MMQSRAFKVGVGFCAVIAGLWFGAQSLAMVSTRTNPELASQLGLYSGRADEKLAIARVEADDNGITDVSAASALAQQAFATSAMRGEAAAILALGLPSAEARGAALNATSQLKQRGRLLNFAQLQHSAETGDMDLGLRAADRLLTLYPSIRNRLVPVLGSFLAEDGAMEIYQDLLASKPSWVNQFFELHQLDDESMRRLGLLRLSMGRDAGTRLAVDQKLVGRLITRGHFAEASEIYTLITDDAADGRDAYAIGWENNVPPFDWQFADERDFHARPSSSNTDLRVRIDAGQGGQLARRVINVPQGSEAVEFAYALDSGPRDGALEVRATCQPSGLAAEVQLPVSNAGTAILPLPDGECDVIDIVIEGRVFTGRTNLRGQINAMRFVEGR